MKRPQSAQIEPIHYLRDWQPRGVIHVGANDGEEFVYYKSLGIKNLVGFEPLEAPFKKFEELHPDVLKFQVGWGNKNERVKINVTENDKASSVLPVIDIEGDWREHEVFKDWNMGQWEVVGEDTIEIVRYGEWINKDFYHLEKEPRPYNPEDYNFLNMDVQGMELDALKGMGDQLNYFDCLVIECSEKPVYKGEHSAAEVVEWLASKGFERCSPIKLHNDILFLRKDKLA